MEYKGAPEVRFKIYITFCYSNEIEPTGGRGRGNGARGGYRGFGGNKGGWV